MRLLIARLGMLRVLTLLLAVTFAAQCAVVTGAQGKSSGPAPVKVSEAEAQKYLRYASRNSSMAQGLRLHGSVKMEYTVNVAGAVVDIVPVAGDTKGPVWGFAKDLVTHWQYDPYKVNGKPTPMRTSTTITFNY